MNQTRASFLAVWLAVAVTGCINLPDIEPEGPTVEPDLVVRLLTPAATTYTNGAVAISVEVTNGTPEAVELYVGDELHATLTSPYTFQWDTTAKPEDTYILKVKARRGAQTFTSEAREVVVDRTPPQVVLITPEAGSTGVRASHPIQAVVSEALNPGSVITSSIYMKVNGSDVELKPALSADGKILTLAPAVAISLPAQVEIVLTEGLRDLAGNPLTSLPNGWSWNIPDFFLVEQVLRLNGQPAFAPSMQLDASGKPIIAAIRAGYGYVYRWTGSSWQQMGTALNVLPGGTLAGPSLQLNATGEPVVAWTEASSSSRDAYVARWTGSNWAAVGSALSAVPGETPADFVQLQLDSAGNPVVAITESDGQARNVYVRRWDGSAWEAVGGALSAKPGATHVNIVSLRLDPSGNPIVSWMEQGESVYSTAYISRWMNGQWTMLGSVLGPNPGSNFIEALALAVDSTGNPIIVILRNNGMSSSPQLSVLKWVGEEWTALGEALTGFALAPVIQIDLVGRPVVAWTAGSPVGNVYIKRWTGVAWESLGGALSALPGFSSASTPALQLNADGYPVVAWSEVFDTDGGVYVASFNY